VEAEPASEIEKYDERRRIWFQQDGGVCMTRSETKRDKSEKIKDGLQIEIHILFIDFSQESWSSRL
jgi:hypothetical protein